MIEEVRTWYEKNPSAIYPRKFYETVMNSMSCHEHNISVSRDRKRVPWGIQTPSDPDQTVYVWLDALVNYLTIAGFPDIHSDRFTNTWPADCHLIGEFYQFWLFSWLKMCLHWFCDTEELFYGNLFMQL